MTKTGYSCYNCNHQFKDHQAKGMICNVLDCICIEYKPFDEKCKMCGHMLLTHTVQTTRNLFYVMCIQVKCPCCYSMTKFVNKKSIGAF